MPRPAGFELVQPWPLSRAASIWLLLAALALLSSAGGCRREPSDGDADADADGDADGDGDSDADGDEAGDADDGGSTGCDPQLGGPCNPVEQCGCGEGELCGLTVDGTTPIEACAPGVAGTLGHGEDCSADPAACAPDHICLGMGTGAYCMRLCTDHSVCPERSLCSMGFTMGDADPAPYRACSVPLAEADATYAVCTGAPGACPAAGGEDRTIDSAAGSTWSCTIDVTQPDEITLNFEMTQGDIGVRGANLVFPFQPSRIVTATCEAFTITEGGVDFDADTCMTGYPTEGSCVVTIDFAEGAVGANFRCIEIPGASGSDVLSTMNGPELGGGSLGLRACDIIE